MIHVLPVLADNYCYVVEADGGRCIVIDPGEVTPVDDFLSARNLTPIAILNTHHHGDHVGGNITLKQKYNLQIIGPLAEAAKIPGFDRGVAEGDMTDLCGLSFQTLETPGHTLGHVIFYLPDRNALFTGDTLFSLGCGRLFEGTAELMFESLAKIKALSADTEIYFGHEYSAANAAFALAEDADNQDLQQRAAQIATLRRNGRPTAPVTLAAELAANPFLRAASVNEFAGLRARKDRY